MGSENIAGLSSTFNTIDPKRKPSVWLVYYGQSPINFNPSIMHQFDKNVGASLGRKIERKLSIIDLF